MNQPVNQMTVIDHDGKEYQIVDGLKQYVLEFNCK